MKKRFLLIAFLIVTIALSFSGFYVPIVEASPDTFGKTDIGGTPWDSWLMWASKYPLTEAGDVTKITVYVDGVTNVKVAIYAESGGVPTSLLASAEKACVAGWNDITLLVSLPAGNYFLAARRETDLINFYYDAGSTNQTAFRTIAYADPWPDPFGVPDAQQDREYSIYATYTPSGEEYERPASQSITMSLTAARLFETAQTATQAIGIGLATSGIPNFVRAVTQAITASLSADRLIEITLQASQAISVSLSAERLIEVTKTASQTITIALEAAGFKEFYRTVAQAITVGLATIRIPDFARSAAQAISVGLNADRLIEVTRQATQTLGISIVGDRLIEVSKSVTQAINFVLEGDGWKNIESEKTASLAITFVSGIMGLFFDDYATKGFVLAAIFLLIFIGAPITALIWRKR